MWSEFSNFNLWKTWREKDDDINFEEKINFELIFISILFPYASFTYKNIGRRNRKNSPLIIVNSIIGAIAYIILIISLLVSLYVKINYTYTHISDDNKILILYNDDQDKGVLNWKI